MTPVNTHFIGDSLFEYCESLALEECKVEPIPSVFFEIYWKCGALKRKYYRSYHSAVFKILENDEYIVEFDENTAKNK